ncbi:DUF5134 domain-containing protein [Actinophytocola sp.]|uniref:DUF5134 domain-containing protein n=1 Tax=Actinophytocola sp. TaxID=1872138 RepID=UPI002D594B06|nr:DUF5134 domain-containing protein [Actinophytocola sp.]HYQ67353.1 DUF5134 domain-containing protein [Actinophytocola sp.]
MIAELMLRWIVTIAFAAVGVFCDFRAVTRGPARSRVSDVLHGLMCAGMIAMAWPAGMDFARVPQLFLFTAATVWFAGMLVIGAGGHGRWSLAHHALMMGGMAWMVLVMPTVMAGMTMEGTASGGGHAGHDMGGATMTMNTPAHVVFVAVVLAVVFLVAGIAWLARAFDAGRHEETLRMPTAGLAAEGIMSLGMALMAAVLV